MNMERSALKPLITFKQFDCVKTTVSKPEAGLKKGSSGTIMDVYDGPPQGYEVSFNKNDALEVFRAHELRLAFPGPQKRVP